MLRLPKRRCAHCGMDSPDVASKCVYCGRAQLSEPFQPSSRSRKRGNRRRRLLQWWKGMTFAEQVGLIISALVGASIGHLIAHLFITPLF